MASPCLQVCQRCSLAGSCQFCPAFEAEATSATIIKYLLHRTGFQKGGTGKIEAISHPLLQWPQLQGVSAPSAPLSCYHRCWQGKKSVGKFCDTVLGHAKQKKAGLLCIMYTLKLVLSTSKVFLCWLKHFTFSPSNSIKIMVKLKSKQ